MYTTVSPSKYVANRGEQGQKLVLLKLWTGCSQARADVGELVLGHHHAGLAEHGLPVFGRHDVDALLADVAEPVVPRHVWVMLHRHQELLTPAHQHWSALRRHVDCKCFCAAALLPHQHAVICTTAQQPMQRLHKHSILAVMGACDASGTESWFGEMVRPEHCSAMLMCLACIAHL